MRLRGELALPTNGLGLVLFAHGSGSSRHSPRNRYVARELFCCGIGTLLFELLTAEEDRDYVTRFDIRLLSARLAAATEWVVNERLAGSLPLGYFGASTGAAAALVAASGLRSRISAVVSRGGRPDLARADVLSRETAPTMLIVGGNDSEVIALNRDVPDCLRCPKALRSVPGATHLFEEPGALQDVAAIASEWFRCWFAVGPGQNAGSELREN